MHSGFRSRLIPAGEFALLITGLTLCAGPVAAQETVVQFDPANTHVGFMVSSTLHTVHGEFKLKQGVIRFDPATGAASGAIVIDASSGDSGSEGRDSRMHKNILESKKYPEITFRPQHVKGRVAPEGDSQVEVEGTFNIHGADHPMTLVAKVKANGGTVNVDTQFEVPYIKWGMKNPSTFILRVADKVDIEIHATGHVQQPPAA
jgi:polyisoprenoid-binding protein YceI